MNKTYVKPEVKVLPFASESILAASTTTIGVYDDTTTTSVLGKQAFYEYEEGEEEDYAW